MRASAQPRWQEHLTDVAFALAIASLFWGIRRETPIGLLRPFEPLTLVCVGLMAMAYGRRFISAPPALTLHILFLAWYVASAFTVSPLNGLREGLQVTFVLTFVVMLVALMQQRPGNNVMRYTAILLAATCIYVAAWHLLQGIPAGYKRLGEAKAAFIVLPAIVMAFAAWRGKLTALHWIAVAVAVLFVVLAGERKAYICLIAMVLSIVGLSAGKISLAGAGIAAAVLAAVALDGSGYVSGQLDSLFSVEVTEDFRTLSNEVYPESMSNAQRQFAFQAGLEFFQRAPLTGIGSNAYAPLIVSEYGHLPGYLLTSIHGEFMRVLVENGLIGWILYCLAWASASIAVLRGLPRAGLLRGYRGAPQVRLLMLTACLVFNAFESAKSLTIFAFLAPALLPMLLPDRAVSIGSVAAGARAIAPRALSSQWKGHL